MKFKRIGSTFILVFAALIWGVAFVAQSVGMEFVGPFTFNTARSVLGGTVLIPCILILDKTAGNHYPFGEPRIREARKTLLKGGLLWNCTNGNSALQQIGIFIHRLVKRDLYRHFT